MLLFENMIDLGSEKMTAIWEERVRELDYAFQPIVDGYSGGIFGYEALLRNSRRCGFSGIFALFDAAFADRVLYALDLRLRRKALEKFRRIPGMEDKTLFYNLDNRLLEMPDYSPGNTAGLLEELGIRQSQLCFELSERHEFDSLSRTGRLLRRYKTQGYRIAMDDYGSGYSGLQLLYHSHPDVLKIDRFFIEGVSEDPRKKLLAEHTVAMAHRLGIKVVAEGIENDGEREFCRSIGCDLLQGFRIARPEKDVRHLSGSLPFQSGGDRRQGEEKPSSVLEKNLCPVPPITLDEGSDEILKRFRREELPLLPVVDPQERPIGCIRERDLKDYAYSPYGIALFRNRSHSRGPASFLSPIPTAEVTESLANLVETAASQADAGGILITRRGRYLGILEPSKLLGLVNEQRVAEARDQNPLTRLPGNSAINRRLRELLERPGRRATAVYFDFNSFKPFNDVYGFRLGDRVIILFAEILKKELNGVDHFLGHVGGDDFFLLLGEGVSPEEAELLTRTIQEAFADSVLSYYGPADRQTGGITAPDRYGTLRRFPFLRVSAALMTVGGGTPSAPEAFTREIMKLKKQAKASPDSFAAAPFPPAALPL